MEKTKNNLEKTGTAHTETKRTLKKITTDVIKLSDQEVGFKLEGKYIGRTSGPWVDKTTGEEKELVRLFFERPNKTKFLVFEDGGLRNAMANAMVKEGDSILIEKMEQVSIGNGRKSNQYDIYQYAD